MVTDPARSDEPCEALAGDRAAPDLDAIKARLAAITPVHWVAGMEIGGGESGFWDSAIVYAFDELPVPSYPWGGGSEELCEQLGEWADAHEAGNVAQTHNYSSIPDEQHDANQRLIAHAPADLAALVAHVEDLRRLLGDAFTMLREVWTAGSAEGRFGDIWNLAGSIDAALDPASKPVFMPAHSPDGNGDGEPG